MTRKQKIVFVAVAFFVFFMLLFDFIFIPDSIITGLRDSIEEELFPFFQAHLSYLILCFIFGALLFSLSFHFFVKILFIKNQIIKKRILTVLTNMGMIIGVIMIGFAILLGAMIIPSI
jgi:hypothetical protein